MLENLVAWVLNAYVGEYLENLLTDQFSVTLLQGQVELENVPFKKTALRKMDIPLQIKAGVIGKLALSVPLTRIRSEPWVLKMSDLFIMLEPTKSGKYDIEGAEIYEQKKKDNQLNELEKYHKRQLLLNAGIPVAAVNVEQSWWGASLMSTILNNIQLIISNVHIRYEDGTTDISGTPFNCGLRIHNITIQTTDSAWQPGFVNSEEDANVFKKLEVKGVSLYWNSGGELSDENISLKDLQSLMAPETGKNNTFLLQPFGAELLLEKNSSKFPLKCSPAVPRFKCSLRLEKISIEMGKRQLREMRMISEEWSRYERARQHRKWRPLITVDQNAKEWWNFAYNRVLSETRLNKERRSWKFVTLRARQLNAYCRAYRRRLLSYLDSELNNSSSAGPIHDSPTSDGVQKTQSEASISSSSSLESSHSARMIPKSNSSKDMMDADHFDKSISVSEDSILMKQIERDRGYSYHELNLFRETVFRQLIENVKRQNDSKASQSQSMVTVAEIGISKSDQETLVTEEQRKDDEEKKRTDNGTAMSENSGGLYRMFESWLYGTNGPLSSSESENVKPADSKDDVVEGENNVSSDLKFFEKQLGEEILDVLNESWDDSTVLRRDNLLAEVDMKIDQLTIRFVNEKEESQADTVKQDGCSEFLARSNEEKVQVTGVNSVGHVLAMDMWRVTSHVHLSPKQHTTAISLLVGDLSIQRLHAAPCPVVPDPTHQPNEDSLMFGGGGLAKETTQLLFAIGKTQSEMTTASVNPKGNNFLQQPLLQLFYRRKCPKLIAEHVVEARFSKISVMYDEGAFEGLGDLFDTNKDASLMNGSPLTEISTVPSVPPIDIVAHFRMNVRIPEVQIEMRTKRGGLLENRVESECGSPFACAVAKQMNISLINSRPYESKVTVGMTSFELKDLFEPSGPPLVLTVAYTKLSSSKTLSASCPSLYFSAVESDATESSSHDECAPAEKLAPPDLSPPATLTLSYSNSESANRSHKLATSTTPNPTNAGNLKRRTGFDDASVRETSPIIFSILIVDPKHQCFDSTYEGVKYMVRLSLPDMQIGMNRRSWTMLMDFFGLLGKRSNDDMEMANGRSMTSNDADHQKVHSSPGEVDVASAMQAAPIPFGVKFDVSFSSLKVNMNYPADSSQLGTVSFGNLTAKGKVIMANDEEPLLLSLSFENLSMTDSTPFYSQMYNERFIIRSSSSQSVDSPHSSLTSRNQFGKVMVDIVKYFTGDMELKRPFDISVSAKVPCTMEAAFVHSHRYVCAVVDFWTQLVELQNQVMARNKPDPVKKLDEHHCRVLLNVDIACATTVILLLNQFCDQSIILEAERLKITNQFRFAFDVPLVRKHYIAGQYSDDDNVANCLLDWMMVSCSQIGIYESIRIPVGAMLPSSFKGYVRVCEDIFLKCQFYRSCSSILSRSYDLNVDVLRNLDLGFSHKVPDMAAITEISDIVISFSTDFYKVLRGFLGKNLGEVICPTPETIPIEVLLNPVMGCEIGSLKYATFSLRIGFRSVKFMCSTPSKVTFDSFDPFASVCFNRSCLSFDAFIDNQSELDLVCQDAELIDVRYSHLPSEARLNIFDGVIRPRHSATMEGAKLMLETHLLMRKDEPPVVTLILVDSRVLLLLGWLNDVKNFILLDTDFDPIVIDCDAVRTSSLCDGKSDLSLSKLPNSIQAREQTISLKVTLKGCDLCLIESPQSLNSLALIGHGSADLSMSDPHGKLTAHLEIKEFNLCWCLMSSEVMSRCQLTNDFKATAELLPEVATSLKQEATKLLRGSSVAVESGYRIKIDFGDSLVGRFSYRDFLVVHGVLQLSMKNLLHSLSQSAIPTHTAEKDNGLLNITRIQVASKAASLWLLDDFQGTAFPLLRILLKDLLLEKYLDKMSSSFCLAIDYFNQRIFGWEPLLEPWVVRHLLFISKDISDDKLRSSWSRTTVEFHAEDKSVFDVNVTQVLLQQAVHFHARWSEFKLSLDRDLRSLCFRSRSDHLPYELRNETGSDLIFSIDVTEIVTARIQQRKPNAKWFTVPTNSSCTFEFPTKHLDMKTCSEEPRQLIIRVNEWDEISPVNVDSVGTYFRIARYSTSDPMKFSNARLVTAVTMDRDGRKVVTVRSAVTFINNLPDSLMLFIDNEGCSPIRGNVVLQIEPKQALPIPLKFSSARISIKPSGCIGQRAVPAAIDWRCARQAGEVVNSTIAFSTSPPNCYWVCSSVKREHYPEFESLPGHTIRVLPPLSLLNLLPIDIEVLFNGMCVPYPIGAGKQLQITTVNVEEVFNLRISTEHFMTANTVAINKNSLAQKAFSGEVSRLDIKMKDISGRPLDIYGSLYVGQGGSISLSFWVPYWIVNKSGIPLIIKQEASSGVAAGQFEEHERAKDRHPLMFSFAYDNCPTQCKIRVGKKFLSDPSYKPMFSEKFQLTLGVQALKLFVTHDHLATLIYNIGVEVRQGTGRYKDTQVVLLTPRYLLNNQSSYELSLSHVDYIDQPSQHVRIASKCNLVWNENFEDKRMLCIKRSDVEHWSCPFRIDRITSFHVTMRAADETPCFVRVEIILNSAVFCVTFTDAQYFPPPIQIENFSDVPILYHQKIEKSKWSHLRAICKANSTVDYAWDDHHAAKLLVLQVFENKSNIYDPQKPGHGPPLIYDNDVYIKFVQSFERLSSHDGFTDECELVLEVMRNGKVKLNKMNPSDSTHSQLWRFSNDGCLENMAMNNRAKVGERYVLDVLDKAGYVLMMSKRNSARDQFQKWEMSATKQLKCGVQGMAVEVRADEILLARPHPRSQRNSQGVPLEQLWELQSQRPGSGVLDVECLHKGPTLVIRISDRANSMKERISRPLIKIGSAHRSSSSFTKQHLYDIEVSVSLIAGIGVSLVNGQHEELLYARFSNISLVANRSERTFQITSSVEAIQIDNQLLSADHWQVLYCQFSAVTNEIGQSSSQVKRPALKLEMKCTPMLHYDAFDCFRLKICDIALHLDELLLWKIVQFFQESGTAGSVQPNAFLQPPNTDLYRPDPLQARRCYFGTLDLEIGRVALSVVTVPKSGLPRELRALKRQFNVKLVSFENAIIALPPFRQFRYFETFSFLVETLSKFYIAHLKNQTFNIVVTMDAFGNPSGLASDLKDSFEGLLFEGDLSGFVSSLGYGVTNSISKVASSMAYGVGSLTFDEQHEVMRQRMLHTAVPSESSNALAHLYSGVKGLGVGVFGGLTAIVTNTYTEGRKAGLTGAIKGLTTGAVDTVTKPVQGIFDLVEGTASAVKEMVGGPSARKSRFPERPIRLPRVCMNLQLLLPCYSSTLASNQLDLLRINGFTRNEVLLDVELLLDQPTHSGRFRQYALICSEQCYIIRRIENEPSNVIQRISYKNLKQIQPISGCETPLVSLEVVLELSNGKRQVLPPLWCGQIHIAKVLCDKVMRAKELYEHSKRTLAVAEEFDGF